MRLAREMAKAVSSRSVKIYSRNVAHEVRGAMHGKKRYS